MTRRVTKKQARELALQTIADAEQRRVQAALAAAACSPEPPVMTEEDDARIIERTNQACLRRWGKTLCQMLEEGEAESAQENDRNQV